MHHPRLGVNIDHIATLRQARRGNEPDPLDSIPILKACGVDQVTCHLREDRRHIQDQDVIRLIESAVLPVNLELALDPAIIALAARLKPATCTFVPEKREEITTEGGLNCRAHLAGLREVTKKLQGEGVRVSLFIAPDNEAIELSAQIKADAVELHTGSYCGQFGKKGEKGEWDRLKTGAREAAKRGLKVFAGHGLDRYNLAQVVSIAEIEEYNIGHSIISRAIFIGLEAAIKEIQHVLIHRQ
ncbi:MAG: pyridoxine 5'-phosphate synthase [Deltaproteobacteria bacterium]|nr:pyridoxine 5'-phosphate synthase [Deltaproteobacteria bacterium]